MSDSDEDPDDDEGPDLLWGIELRYMTGAGLDDLRSVITGVNAANEAFVPDAAYIDLAFGLIASGMECDVEEFAENKAEFLRAFESTSVARDDLMQAAIDNLGAKLGFSEVTATVLGTVELSEDGASGSAELSDLH
jgi:hypothetical protein